MREWERMKMKMRKIMNKPERWGVFTTVHKESEYELT
jgi:hypothetical protein